MNAPYSPFCLCRSCSDRSFWTGLTAMSDTQILERVKGRVMTEEQEKVIEMVKVRLWNSWAKGEQAG